MVGDAFSLDRAVPEPSDGRTNEGGDKDLRETPDGDGDNGNKIDLLHLLSRENTVILYQEGQLDKEKGRGVEHNGDIECLVTCLVLEQDTTGLFRHSLAYKEISRSL